MGVSDQATFRQSGFAWLCLFCLSFACLFDLFLFSALVCLFVCLFVCLLFDCLLACLFVCLLVLKFLVFGGVLHS